MTGLPRDLALPVGGSTTLTLSGLATAGYRWSAEADAEGVVELRWRRGPVEGHPPPGISAPETLTIVGLRPGRVRVRLVQARPWERTAPRASHEVLVSVQG